MRATVPPAACPVHGAHPHGDGTRKRRCTICPECMEETPRRRP